MLISYRPLSIQTTLPFKNEKSVQMIFYYFRDRSPRDKNWGYKEKPREKEVKYTILFSIINFRLSLTLEEIKVDTKV